MQGKIFSAKGKGPYSPEFFYTKKKDITEYNGASMLLRSKRLRMHKKALVFKIRAQDEAVKKLLEKSREFSPELLKIAASGRPLLSSQERVLKNEMVLVLGRIEKAMNGELQFMSPKEKDFPNATGNVNRMHDINNAELAIVSAAEFMESTGVVRKGFVEDCLQKAGYHARIRLHPARKLRQKP
ncbi:MAG: hypothetical protein AABW59_03790 [archaeon]